MSAIKNNLNNITGDSEAIARDYKKLIMLKFSEKFALTLGILTSVFIISTLLLIVVVFCSFSLAGYLNKILQSEFLGFLVVTGIYFLTIFIILIRMLKTQSPLLTNLFVKLIVFILDVEVSQSKNIKGIKQERENVKVKIDADKVKIEADIQMLRYSLMESLFGSVLSWFTTQKKKSKGSSKSDTAPTKDE